MSIKDQDLEIWKKWNSNKSPANASEMVNQMLPVVHSDIIRYSNNSPYAIIEAHAKNLILRAAESYNPNLGIGFATYVKSYMIRLNQVDASLRTPMRIPENRSTKFPTFRNAYETLADSMGREPTITEIADYLKWSPAEVKRFLQELRGEFLEERPFVSNYGSASSKEEELIDYIYHDLSTTEKRLFEYVTGYGGKPKLKNAEIMQRMGWNQNRVSYEKKKLADKIQGIMQR